MGDEEDEGEGRMEKNKREGGVRMKGSEDRWEKSRKKNN